MKAAFIGLGTMGAAMAMNILKAGHSLTVYNRNRDRELPLEKEGAKRAATPREAAADADVVVICVSDTPDVEAIVLGENGVIHGAKAGTVVVDCSTISPAATRKMGQALAQKGIKMIDAPVSGGSEGAINATLAIMIGGETQDVEKAMPVLEAMGKTITHVGPLGAGQITKAINQTILCGYYFSLGEGMALGIKAGLDMKKVVQAISGGACNSWVLTYRSENMIKNEYPLGFRVSLHNKDVRIALETARELGVSLPVAGLVAQIENGLIGRGLGDEDVSNMARAIREQSGID